MSGIILALCFWAEVKRKKERKREKERKRKKEKKKEKEKEKEKKKNEKKEREREPPINKVNTKTKDQTQHKTLLCLNHKELAKIKEEKIKDQNKKK